MTHVTTHVTTHVSMSELEATLCKALQGLGFALGLGEEAGRALRHALARSWNPLPDYCAALDALNSGRSGGFALDDALSGRFRAADPEKALSALLAAPSACDCLASGQAHVTLDRLDRPAVLLAQALVISLGRTEALRVSWSAAAGRESGSISCRGGDLWAAPEGLPSASAKITLSLGDAAALAGPPWSRASQAERSGVELPAAGWQTLYGYYARTLVEASETSRLAGAGAGLTDND